MATGLTIMERPVARLRTWLNQLNKAAIEAWSRWRALEPRIRRAISRVRSTKGWREKSLEVGRLARKARERLDYRAAIKAARRYNTGSAKLAEFLASPGQVPDCRALGGGVLILSLDVCAGETPEVTLRDRFGIVHSTRTIETTRFELAVDRQAYPAAAIDDTLSAGKPRTGLRVFVQSPTELFDSAPGQVDVQVNGLSKPLTFPGVTLDNSTALAVTRFSVDHNLVVFGGTSRHVPEEVELKFGLFVDGRLSVSTSAHKRGPSFFGSILLGYEHFDGKFHHFELRSLPEMTFLASMHQLLPLHLTPWSALQTYSQTPLDGTLAPAARHHFRSFRLWLDKLTEGCTTVPPVGRLYEELLQGFRKRQDYPKLAFLTYARAVASVVIPVHDRFEITYLCLCSLLFAYNDTPFEVIVVDDGSSDETMRIAEFVTGIRVVRHESAQGFVNSCNDGAAMANGEFIVFLNNDVEATARWLDEMFLVFRNFDDVGLVGCKLVYPDGRLQEAGGIIWNSGNPWNVGRGGNAYEPRYNYLREADYVSGAAMMIPREIWTRVGGFSTEFAPGYFEDTDLAMKVRAAGYRIIYTPTATIIHFEGQSAGTDTSSGMKQYQEINRPKFRQKWAAAVAGHGAEGQDADREKDREAALRVLFLDHQFPKVDADAGSYAAFQEIRLLQRFGAKVTFLPRNLAWMDRHTLALQRIGVECLYAPYVTNYIEFIRTNAAKFEAIFICRHQIAQQVVPLVRSNAPSTKILFNFADLHFLRELREAAAGTPGYTQKQAEATREAELDVVQSVDLSFSYSDFELALLDSFIKGRAATARLPWVVEARRPSRRFRDTRDLLFLGGFIHPPNARAVKFFASEVMPALQKQFTDIRFDVVGHGAEEALKDCSPDAVRIVGYVADLDMVLASHRVFVAPLLTGAGLKGKVIEAISRGVPCVLSPVAAEGTGLIDGVSCLIADGPEQWVEHITRLYTDEGLWSEVGENALRLAQTRYSFDKGAKEFAEALNGVGIRGKPEQGLVYRHVRPPPYGY